MSRLSHMCGRLGCTQYMSVAGGATRAFAARLQAQGPSSGHHRPHRPCARRAGSRQAGAAEAHPAGAPASQRGQRLAGNASERSACVLPQSPGRASSKGVASQPLSQQATACACSACSEAGESPSICRLLQQQGSLRGVSGALLGCRRHPPSRQVAAGRCAASLDRLPLAFSLRGHRLLVARLQRENELLQSGHLPLLQAAGQVRESMPAAATTCWLPKAVRQVIAGGSFLLPQLQGELPAADWRHACAGV